MDIDINNKINIDNQRMDFKFPKSHSDFSIHRFQEVHTKPEINENIFDKMNNNKKSVAKDIATLNFSPIQENISINIVKEASNSPHFEENSQKKLVDLYNQNNLKNTLKERYYFTIQNLPEEKSLSDKSLSNYQQSFINISYYLNLI